MIFERNGQLERAGSLEQKNGTNITQKQIQIEQLGSLGRGDMNVTGGQGLSNLRNVAMFRNCSSTQDSLQQSQTSLAAT